MDLQDLFPENPLEPTVAYAGATQTFITLPWAEGTIQLCKGFNTARAQSDGLFMERSAFEDTSRTRLQYRVCNTTSIKDCSATNIADSAENTGFSISASVGGDFLGVSAQGQYEKSVRESQNQSSISVCAEHICGNIELIQQPPLGADAVQLLRSADDPVKAFGQVYGDFYLAGCRVGAINRTTISGRMVNKAYFEGKRAELEVKALWTSTNRSVNEVNQSASDIGGLKVAAFDSLAQPFSEFIAKSLEDNLRSRQIASDNKARAMTIATRAATVLTRNFSLGHESVLDQKVLDQLCKERLVIELVLCPFATLREYRSVIADRYQSQSKG